MIEAERPPELKQSMLPHQIPRKVGAFEEVHGSLSSVLGGRLERADSNAGTSGRTSSISFDGATRITTLSGNVERFC